MKQSICLIDDRLPLSNEKVKSLFENPNRKIQSSEIKALIKNVPISEWDERELNELLNKLNEEENYNIAAFTNPEFFFIHNEFEEEYRPQIIVLDWDFGGTKPTEEHLLELLEFSFSLIFIFTGKDNAHNVDQLISSDPYKKYRNRIFVLHKGDQNSAETLKKIIDESKNENFSFSFGQDLRNSSIRAVDRILVDLGKVSVNQLWQYLKIIDGGSRDFFDFLTERFRSIISIDNYKSLEASPGKKEEKIDEEIAKAIWSYRLYNNPPLTHTRVARGDVISFNDTYCFVVSADCDLARFWHKNYGTLNVIPLHKIEKGNEKLKRKFMLTRPAGKVDFKHNSISSEISGLAEGSFILPFINEMILYGFPKELRGIPISLPAELQTNQEKINAGLKYSNLPEGSSRLVTLSEPFLTPLIQHILNSIAGYGVPDYPPSIVELIVSKAKEVLS